MTLASFCVDGKKVGGDAPCFIVAEIGANHDGDLARARELIDIAADAGADAVKFQTYTAAELVADPDRILTWGRIGIERTESIGCLFDRLALPRSAHMDLFEYARSRGMIAFSTPFSIDGVEFLSGLNVPIWKVASSDVRDKFLLERLVKTGKPIILSTGKSLLSEVARAVETLRSGHTKFALLHCLAQYPAPIRDVNLATIPAFKTMFHDAVVGYSDHTIGMTSALGAVALGAKIIERHITYSQTADGPDHWFSASPQEFRALCREIRNLESAIGSVRSGIMDSELHERLVSTRSLVLSRSIRAGEIISIDHLVAKRPGFGIDPYDAEKIVGIRVPRDLEQGLVLTWDSLKS